MVKKKIPFKDRAFDDVLDDLKLYFRGIGKRLPPTTLKDVLIDIGVPKTKRVVKVEQPVIEPETVIVEPPPQEVEVIEQPKELDMEPTEPSTITTGSGVNPDASEVITGSDLQDISKALSAVEKISDSFMSGKSIQEDPSEITIEIEGEEEIVASEKSMATLPRLVPKKDEAEDEEAEDALVKLTPIGKEDLPTLEAFDVDSQTETDEELVETTVPTSEEEEQVESMSMEDATKPQEKVVPDHVVKPIMQTKVVIVGEEGVGKRSILDKAELGPLEIDGETVSWVRSKLFEAVNNRIDLHVWSFDDAAKSNIARNQFYSHASVIIIVYSASDRWSFDSIDFWFKEATATYDVIPPIVIVANKTDLRVSDPTPEDEQPVTYEEGFGFAESLANALKEGDALHPVAYIETSCLTGDGVTEVFQTAANLYEKQL
ncbi:MAG: Rab family GTPase [Candidatus Thorarchaeota archaeon]|jgi:GTPase SAR1 family protein